MILSDIKEQGGYVLKEFLPTMDLGLHNKLISMGISEDTIIYIFDNNFISLITFYIDNKKFVLRKKDAKHIEVGKYDE